jgi:hypothetical protein
MKMVSALLVIGQWLKYWAVLFICVEHRQSILLKHHKASRHMNL